VSPVDLWAQICAGNAASIRAALQRLRVELDRLDQALDAGAELERMLARAQRRAEGSE